MRKPLLALPGLLLALAAAVPATADPLRLDEARRGGVAARAPVGVPGHSLSTLDATTTTTSTDVSSSVESTIGQTLTGSSANMNYATGIGSTGVTATGSAVTSVTGSILPGSGM